MRNKQDYNNLMDCQLDHRIQEEVLLARELQKLGLSRSEALMQAATRLGHLQTAFTAGKPK